MTDDPNRKERTLYVRLSDEEHRRIRVLAAQGGVSMTELVRAWVSGLAKKEGE